MDSILLMGITVVLLALEELALMWSGVSKIELSELIFGMLHHLREVYLLICLQLQEHNRCYIITNNVEVGNNESDESHEVIRDERVRVANCGPEKRLDNDIFVIVSDEYKNKGFL